MTGNFNNIGKSFSMITRMVAEAAAADLAKYLLGDLVKGGSGKGAFGDIFSTVASSFFGGAKAGGGDVIEGRSYLVGEQGPERFVPRTAGTIIPAAQTAQTGSRGDMNVQQHFAITGPADRRTQEQIASAAARGLMKARARGTA